MQDRYAGDIGDFGKYGLLRALCGGDEHGPALDLGVLWYAFEGDKKRSPNDGAKTGYVHSERGAGFEECHEQLFSIMRTIVCEKNRSIQAIEQSGALPNGTVCFSTPLTFKRSDSPAMRRLKRLEWLDKAVHALQGADLVFADPDNGLEIASRDRLEASGPKHAYYSDVARLAQGGRSIVIYHQLGRSHAGKAASANEQILPRLADLGRVLPGDARPFALRYHRGSPRVFFVVPSQEQEDELRTRVGRFLSSPWGRVLPSHKTPHFTLFEG